MLRYGQTAGLILVLFAAACASGGDGPAIDRGLAADAKADGMDLCWLLDLEPGCDICAELGWYGDGICDDFCTDPDPDCGVACGSRGMAPCAPGQFCNIPSGCGRADGPGVCQEIPTMCTREFAPVCGCDGETYSNACNANAAGMSVDYEGECETAERTCGGFMGLTCEDDEYCDYTDGCGFADQMGVCTLRPGDCTYADPGSPVCGCNGESYVSSCHANMNGVDVATEGPCEIDCPDPADPRVHYIADSDEDPTVCWAIMFTCEDGQELFSDQCGCGCIDSEPAAQTCGGTLGLTCADDEYCDYGDDGYCGDGMNVGVCAPRPGDCTYADPSSPVCGCDESTYVSSCHAHRAGTSVSYPGACVEPPADCRDTGCGEGEECQFCWGTFECIPEGAMC